MRMEAGPGTQAAAGVHASGRAIPPLLPLQDGAATRTAGSPIAAAAARAVHGRAVQHAESALTKLAACGALSPLALHG